MELMPISCAAEGNLDATQEGFCLDPIGLYNLMCAGDKGKLYINSTGLSGFQVYRLIEKF